MHAKQGALHVPRDILQLRNLVFSQEDLSI
jgi:hypothetical protein